jgi:Gamma interferon inducible lysosomal thiol reductase (GILT)
VMSKCPDAADAEGTLVNVMENVGQKVSLNFTYIASYVNFVVSSDNISWGNTTQGQEIICKHGATECLGNKQQLW